MNRNYFLAIVGATILSVLLIIFSFWRQNDKPQTAEHIIYPPRSPFQSYITGVGVVEPLSGNIFISTPLNRIVERVFVTVGDQVKKGDILIKLESRDLEADLFVKEMAYKSAEAKLQKLEALPHPDDLASAEAAFKNAQAEREQSQRQYDMILSLPDPRAISQEEKDRRQFRYQQSQERFKEAQAKFEKVKSGSWKPDLEIARFEVKHAAANVDAIKTEIERTSISSPIDGTVLQVKVHEGEFSAQATPRVPLMIVGDTSEMYVRTSINQLEVPYFNANAPAVAFLEGDASREYLLDFVRVEPFLVAKENITNEIGEKVDTRTFQIIYKIRNGDPHIYTGARMDVFIERDISR
jgi:multidrug efflux pump subunit AcrA (membrane-fusion protein)